MVTPDGVYNQHPQTTSEQDAHSSLLVEHMLTSKQDSAVESSHLSDTSCLNENNYPPSTNTEQEVPVCRSPFSVPQQETVGPPQVSLSEPSQVTMSAQTEDDLIELQKIHGRILSTKHCEMRNLQAQLSHAQTEIKTLRQKNVKLEKALSALKMENTQLKADKSCLAKRLSTLEKEQQHNS